SLPLSSAGSPRAEQTHASSRSGASDSMSGGMVPHSPAVVVLPTAAAVAAARGLGGRKARGRAPGAPAFSQEPRGAAIPAAASGLRIAIQAPVSDVSNLESVSKGTGSAIGAVLDAVAAATGASADGGGAGGGVPDDDLTSVAPTASDGGFGS